MDIKPPENSVSQPGVNVLLLGGAKRVSIIRKFGAAARRLGYSPEFFSYELDACVPIACVAEVIVGRRWSDPSLVSHVNRIIRDNDIRLVIPFVDGALDVCASGRLEAWSPTAACAADFYDKRVAQRRFIEAGIPVPAPYDAGDPRYPLIAKPVHGSASKGISVLHDAADMRALANPGNYVIEEYIVGGREFTVDCYVSREGRLLCVSPRERLEVVGGEVSRTCTVDRPDIVELSTRAIRGLGLTGAVTIQWIQGADGDLRLMEINPRLGGGAVCTVCAGVDIPEMILSDALGLRFSGQTSPEHGVIITRYFDEVVFHSYNNNR